MLAVQLLSYFMLHLQQFRWVLQFIMIGQINKYDFCFDFFCALQNGKGVLAKSVGVIDATADTVFEVILSTEQQKRYE